MALRSISGDSDELDALAAATESSTAGTTEAPQRADAAADTAVTDLRAAAPDTATDDLLTALDAATDTDAAAAPTPPAAARSDSTDVLTAELDALLAMPAPEAATPPAPPPAPAHPSLGEGDDAEPVAGRGQWVAFKVENAYAAAPQQGAMAAFARKAPEARDVRATLDTQEPWASETLPRIALGADGSLDARFQTCAYVRSDGGGDERLRLEARVRTTASGNDVSLGAAEFSRNELARATQLVVAPLAPGAGAFCRATPLGPDETLDAAARAAGAACLRRAFLLEDGRVLSEACCESVGAHEIVRDVLKPVADGAMQAATTWLARAERERVFRCAFNNDEDARAHGAQMLRIAVLGARGVTRATSDEAPPADVKANLSKLGRSAFGFARRLRSGDLPMVGVEGSAAPSPFVRVALKRDTVATPLGRTNTEYASGAPSFGANARAAKSCPHAAPRVSFEATKEGTRLVDGSDLSPLGIAPVIEAYAPTDGATLVLTLLDERYSVERGIEGEVLGEARVELPPPSAGPPAPCWVPVGDAGAEVFVAVHVAALPGAAAETPGAGEDGDVHAWLGDINVPPASITPEHGWMRRHGEALVATGSTLRKLGAEADAKARAGERCFKASMRKDDAQVSAHATNVHAYLVSVRGLEGGAALLAMATAGAPTAAATLGSDGGGLLKLRRDLVGKTGTAFEARAAAYVGRRALVLSQALQVLAQAVRAKVAALSASFHNDAMAARTICAGWRKDGVDVVFLSLISTAGKELAMLEDVAGIVEELQGVSIDVGGTGYDGATRTLGLGMAGLDHLELGEFKASVVLVAQGLDVRQSLAYSQQTAKDAVSSFFTSAKTAALDVRQQLGGGPTAAPGAPEQSSDDDARRLQNTLNKAAEQRLTARASLNGDGGAGRHFTSAVERETCALASNTFEKHWTIIVEAERLARRLDLPLALFCKSGKDRTGMASTLAAAAFCGEFSKDDERAMLGTANLLRAHGVRLDICEKNTGRRRYAFNVVQREFLPAPFRPPPSTIEDLASSLIHRDMS